jgi:hypothetical protein
MTSRKRASDEDRSLTFAARIRAANVREGLRKVGNHLVKPALGCRQALLGVAPGTRESEMSNRMDPLHEGPEHLHQARHPATAYLAKAAPCIETGG